MLFVLAFALKTLLERFLSGEAPKSDGACTATTRERFRWASGPGVGIRYTRKRLGRTESRRYATGCGIASGFGQWVA